MLKGGLGDTEGLLSKLEHVKMCTSPDAYGGSKPGGIEAQQGTRRRVHKRLDQCSTRAYLWLPEAGQARRWTFGVARDQQVLGRETETWPSQ